MSTNALWWKHNPATFVREIRTMRALENRWLGSLKLARGQEGLLRWTGTIHFLRSYAFELIYPDDFPSGCPSVYPQDRSQTWSKHQWPDGELCTEYGQDTWNSQYTGADIIRSLYDLISTEHRPARGFRPKRPVTSRHDLVAAQRRSMNSLTVVLCPEIFAEAAGPGGSLSLKRMRASRPRRLLLLSLTDKSERSIAAAIPEHLVPKSDDLDGLWYRVGHISQEELFRMDLAALGVAISAQSEGVDLPADIKKIVARVPGRSVPIVLVGPDSAPLAAFLYAASETVLVPIAIAPYDPKLASVRRVAAAHFGFALLRIAVVGLGSLGSKIAVSLARIGIEHFVVCDPDLFLWENLSRHEATAEDVGRLKCDFVADRIRACNPSAHVVEFNTALSEVRAPTAHRQILDALESCSLIIDASGDPRTARYLTDLSYERGISSIHVQVYPRGIGGQLIRVRPPHTGCYQCQSDALAAYLNDKPPAPDADAIDYDVPVDPTGQPITADDDICTIAAGATVRLAKDSLLRQCGDAGSVAGDIYMFGFEREWIFSEAFQFIRIESAFRRPDCSGCSGEEAVRKSLGLSQQEVLRESKAAEAELEEQGDTTLDQRK